MIHRDDIYRKLVPIFVWVGRSPERMYGGTIRVLMGSDTYLGSPWKGVKRYIMFLADRRRTFNYVDIFFSSIPPIYINYGRYGYLSHEIFPGLALVPISV